MTYCDKQPMKISDQREIQIIDTKFVASTELPEYFEFKTLGLKHLNEIYQLINNHYVEDQNNIVKLTFGRDFLYWYFKYIPDGYIIGLLYHKILVGIVSAVFLDMIVYDNKIKVPYVNFLCIQKNLRRQNLAIYLIEELKSRMFQLKIPYALFWSNKNINKSFCLAKEFVIPINHEKLIAVEFLNENPQPRNIIKQNPLCLMSKNDVENVFPKLNKFLEKFLIKPFFTAESAQHFLIPKKNILYSFVKRDENNQVTDFVNIYKNYVYCIKKNKIISTANLGFYFHETMQITELIELLIDKLSKHGIDQLVFKNYSDNALIDITKFSTYNDYYYYFYNMAIKETLNSQVCFFNFN